MKYLVAGTFVAWVDAKDYDEAKEIPQERLTEFGIDDNIVLYTDSAVQAIDIYQKI